MPDLWPDAFRPPLGPGLTLLLIGGAVTAALWWYLLRGRDESAWRRGALLPLRLLAIVGVAWLLAGPSVRVPGDDVTSSSVRLVVFADTSRSMAEADVVIGGRTLSRAEAVGRDWLNARRLVEWSGQARLQVVAFDEQPRRVALEEVAELQPAGRGTHLIDVLGELAHQPQQGAAVVLVLSDGHDTRVGDDAALGRRLREAGWRVLAVPVGARRDSPDLAVHAWADAQRVFDGQTTTIHAQITQRGFDGQRLVLELRRDDEIVESRTLVTPTSGSIRAAFDVAPRAAPGRATTIHGYEIGVRATDGRAPPERVVENNRRHVFVEVTRQKLRVAVFEGQPYWDTRFLVRQLQQDPQVTVTAHVRVSNGRDLVQHDDMATARAENLSSYDAIVLGKGVEAFFGGETAQRLVDYVRQGGALVLARGRPFERDATAAALLAAVEPVDWGERVVGNLRVRLAPGGVASPLLAEIAAEMDAAVTHLPDMIAATVVQGRRAASVVLLEQTAGAGAGTAPGALPGAMAAVVHQRVGEGRVFAVLSDGLWRWAFTPASLAEHESVYALFWSRAIRWLTAGGEFLPGQDWSLQLSHLAAEPGDSVGVTAASRYPVHGVAPRLTVRGPDGVERPVPLTRSAPGSLAHHGAIVPKQSGVYAVTLQLPGDEGTTLTARLAAYDRSVELLDTSARPEVLKALAEGSGGACLDVDDADAVAAFLQDGEAAVAVPDRFEYDLHRPLVLVVIVGALGVEWLCRRRMGWL